MIIKIIGMMIYSTYLPVGVGVGAIILLKVKADEEMLECCG